LKWVGRLFFVGLTLAISYAYWRHWHPLLSWQHNALYLYEDLGGYLGVVAWDNSRLEGLNPYEDPNKCYNLHSNNCTPGYIGTCTYTPQSDVMTPIFEQQAEICGEKMEGYKSSCWKQEGYDREIACLPKFYVIGFMKSGTTAFYESVSRHPDIQPPLEKEVYWLDRVADMTTNCPVCYFSNQVGDLGPKDISFDSTPSYIFHEGAMNWIQKYTPDSKFFVLLRNPAERAFSHWRFAWTLAEQEATSVIKEKRMQECADRADDVRELMELPQYSFDHMLHAYLFKEAMDKCGIPYHEDFFMLWDLAPVSEIPAQNLICLRDQSGVANAMQFYQEMFDAYATAFAKGDKGYWEYEIVNRCTRGLLDGAIWKLGEKTPDVIKRWLKKVPREQFMFIPSQDLQKHTKEVMDNVFEFLEVPPADIGADEMGQICPMKQGIHSGKDGGKNHVTVLKKGENCYSASKKSKSKTHTKQNMELSDWAVSEMKKRFAKTNRQIYRIIGMDLGWENWQPKRKKKAVEPVAEAVVEAVEAPEQAKEEAKGEQPAATTN
jgi:hypothetical protein